MHRACNPSVRVFGASKEDLLVQLLGNGEQAASSGGLGRL